LKKITIDQPADKTRHTLNCWRPKWPCCLPESQPSVTNALYLQAST